MDVMNSRQSVFIIYNFEQTFKFTTGLNVDKYLWLVRQKLIS